eukprot:6118646-Alexandrium_andersonii.AAC.1
MPNLPTKRAGRRTGGASPGGPGGRCPRPPQEALWCATGYRSNRIDRWNRTRRRPNPVSYTHL